MVAIFDLDGVVYLGDTPIPGAIEALNALAEAGHGLYFLTNNSTRSRQHYVDKLAKMGYTPAADQIMTSAYATGLYLRTLGVEGKTVFVVGEHGLAEEMAAIGLEVLGQDDPRPADFVVAGLDRQLTYAKLQRAFQEIHDRGAQFIATNRDATYPMETGEIPGGGAIVAPIEVATGVTPVTIGKPEPGCWLRILELAGAAPQQAVMVGDRPETDIMGAKQVGIATALVLTGVTGADEVAGLPEPQQPDHVIANLLELPALLERLQS